MSNQIVRALEHAAQKLGKTLAEDAGKALKGFYRKAGDNMRKVAKNVREVEEKHAKDLAKIMRGEGRDGVPHPRSGGGRRPGRGGSHPRGRGRDQVKSPRTEGRPQDTRCGGGEPVDMATGRMYIDQVDASLPGSLPLLFTRSFDSGLQTGRWMGTRWICTFDERLEIDADGVVHVRPDRITQAYPHPEPGDPVHASAGSRHELDLVEGRFTVTDPSTGLVKTFIPTPDGDEALLTEVRDRHGRHYTLAYDEDGVPLSITHSGGYRLLVTVDNDRITALRLANATESGGDALLMRYSYTDGHLSAVYNSSGKPMRFTNDATGRLTSWTDRNNSQYRYTYDHLGRVTDEGGTTGALRFTFTYSDPDPATGLRTHTETNALGHTTTYTVNDHAQITAVTDPLGHTTTYERDEYDRLLAETDPLGRTTRYDYDGAGDLVRITRPDGEESTAQYTDRFSLPTVITMPGGVTWEQTYDESGRRLTLTDPLGATTQYDYDDLGHPVSVTDGLGGVTRLRCNPAGLPIEVTGPTGATAYYQHDVFGRTVAITDPLGGVTRMTWAVEGHLVSRTTPDGATRTWTYDGEGNRLTHTDQLGRTTTFEYTHFETLAARTTPDGARYTFDYDANMQLTAVTDPLGRQWTYGYDPAGRVIAESDFKGRGTTCGYDAAGGLTEVTDALGQQTRYRYDQLGRVVTKEIDDRVTTYDYDAAGHLIGAANPDAEISRTVDALGNLLSETVNGRTLVQQRDVLGRRTRQITPTGHTSTWTYDAEGRPTELSTSGGKFDFAYDAGGREYERTVSGTLTLTSAWDGRHRLTGQALRSRSATLQRRSYHYEADDSLVGITAQVGGERTFELDRAGRVTAVRAETWTESYAYDQTGNLVDAHWPAGESAGAALGARTYEGTQLATAGRVRYEYDASGRTVLRQKTRLSGKRDTWRYTWNAEDRLTGVVTPDGTLWRYRYDPLGRRISKERLAADGSTVEERVEFTWDGSRLAEQTTHAPYLPGPYTLSWDHQGRHPLAQTETITTNSASQDQVDRRFFAIVTDLVGTPTELVDPTTETVSWRSLATLWGNTTWPSDSAAYTPLRFPGQYFDPETRLHYNLHRYYDPETARYTSPDPLGLAPAPNSDTYVHNPHTWSDPLGLSPHPPRPPMRWDPKNIDAKYDKHVLGQGKRPGEKADMPEYKDRDKNDDGFGRYEQDAEDLMNRPLGPDIREAVRASDGAVLRLHTPTGRLVFGQNGKITNFFRPDDALEYMEKESNR
ncbi:type IV secretion protein Rhs [Kitasatospora phosalacinea]|uniref:Type IV secretion protein Rhs n=1 Tax=Kitasatospora phosalacinea TaxID=2065 RepID=A0A9W6V0S6_9ACTN|nr:RHS repeat-associated core domain-containing protein [Kitasatospora phosalacinea]GLW68537.1 type IV secretion protein Rhs [Kitasatospora phosalacinea]